MLEFRERDKTWMFGHTVTLTRYLSLVFFIIEQYSYPIVNMFIKKYCLFSDMEFNGTYVRDPLRLT